MRNAKVVIGAVMISFTVTTMVLAQTNTFPSTGNVGIGTTQPTQQLTLGSGNIMLPSANLGTDGNLYLGGVTNEGRPGLRLFGGIGVKSGYIDVRTTEPQPGQEPRDDGLRIRVDTALGATERMRVTANGNVGIGITPDNPVNHKLQLGSGNLKLPNADSDTHGNLYLGDLTNQGSPGLRLFAGIWVKSGFIDVRTTEADEGLRIRVDTSHGDTERMRVAANGNVGIGTTSPGTKLDVVGTTRTQVLQITGGSDLAEPFSIAAAEAIEPGMLVSIDPERPGHLRLAKQAYDHIVAGVVSGANGLSPGVTMGHDGGSEGGSLPVALTGRVYALADATTGPIAPGDLLTTSNTPGHAMKVTDHAKGQGAIIGKAMGALEKDRGTVLVLVSLQ